MGNSSNKKEEEDQNQHERLGPVKLEPKPRTEPMDEDEEESFWMHLTRTVQSEKYYKEWVKSLEQISDSETKEVLFLPERHSFQTVGLCGAGGIVKLTYDYYEFVLKTEVINRSKLKKEFLQTEIWYLLFNIVRAGQKFEHLKRKIGNIHPSNILINESGQIKIISTCSIPGQINNYDQLLESQNDGNTIVYLAPQQINNDLIQKGNYPSHVDPCLAEVFSIGLTILSSGTLQNCDNVYNRVPYELKKDKLNSLLRVFRQKYSDFLYQTVAGMLALNPQERKRCSVIAASLVPFQAQILDLQPFTVPNQPSYKPPAQRISQGNSGVIYNQQNYRPSVEQVSVQQPTYQSNIPPYLNYQQQQPRVNNVGYYPQNNVPVYHRGTY